MLFAAGKGTRLQPFTLKHPKALAKVNGITLLERNVRYLQSFGIEDFVINVHHFGDQIVDFLEKNHYFGARFSISDEHEELLETGGGLMKARPFLEQEENFLIMNVDILTTLDISPMIKAHQERKPMVSLAVSDRESSRKLLFDEKMILKGWLNNITGEQRLAEFNKGFRALAFSGIHCVSSQIFSKIHHTGKFSIMTEYLDLMMSEQIIGYQHEAIIVDVGKPKSVEIAEKYFK